MAELRGGHAPGFRGSVRFTQQWADGLVHAVARRNHHYTVCGGQIDRKDDFRMAGNGQMEVVTCLRCWTMRDPFP